jgi:hypothetical protein
MTLWALDPVRDWSEGKLEVGTFVIHAWLSGLVGSIRGIRVLHGCSVAEDRKAVFLWAVG